MKFVVPFLLALFAGLFFHSLFFQKDHDWDLDAFLYLGSRLHHGRLLYLEDFETKLPLLQYAFAVASALGGIGAWRLLTFFAAVVLGAAASYILASDYLRRSPDAAVGRGALASFLAALYLALLYALPGSESAHIEMTAASAAYMSFALSAADANRRAAMPRQLVSGIFLALAALIRPNYVYLLPFCAAWAYWRSRERPRIGTGAALAFVGGFGLAVLGCFSPYLFAAGGLPALADGLRALANFGEGYSIAALADAQMSTSTIFFYLPAYAATAFVLVGMIRLRTGPRRSLFWIYGAPAASAVLLINLGFVRNHYWPHNAIMFVPYVVALVMLPLAHRQAMLKGASKIRVTAVAAALPLLFAMLGPTSAFVRAAADLARGGSAFDGDINRRRIDARLLAYLAARKAGGSSFLAADEPIFHMLLGESRIGDGHPAMLMHVLQGKKIGPVAAIPLYGDAVRDKPCLAVTASGKAMIVLRKGSHLSLLIETCLRESSHEYNEVAGHGLADHKIFTSGVPIVR